MPSRGSDRNLLREGLVLDAFLSPQAKLTYGRASLWKTDG